ncbi:MAG TPA: histidine kinase [Acidimicrobiia bacterium]
MPHNSREHEHDPVPPWAHVGEVAIPLALVFGVALQRDALIPPGWPALLALLAAVPFLLEPLGLRLPQLLRTAMVLGAVLALVLNPVEIDFAPFFLVFLTAHHSMVASRVQSAIAAVGSIAVMVGVEIAGRYSGAFPYVLGILIAWAWGFAVRQQWELIQQLKAAQAGLAEQAAAEERQRIAREIHDVIAHSLAVTMLHLTGARLAIRRDPEEAEEALLEAERLGRESLAEIRRTVGLLAPEGTGTAAPMPTAADIPELVQEFEAAGLDVELELTGDPSTLAPATGLGLYRVAQESLSNVVRHAPGTPTSISLRIDHDMVRMQVRNQLGNSIEPPTADGGQGVRGMRERITLLGGELQAGPGEHGWSVDVELPRALETA